MKLSELVPQLPRLNKYEQQLNSITGTLSQIYKSGGADSYRSPTLGMDQLVNHWLRQQAAYRQQLVMDLITIALTVEEVASPVHHIISEVFRKGITWAPAFAIKCKQCNTEYQKKIRECKVCGSKDFREPDEKQKEVLDTYLDDANIWDKSLEDLLRGFLWNCLVPGTKVLTQIRGAHSKYVAIENVKAGDMVWTHRGRPRKVIQVFQRTVAEDIVVLMLKGHETIRITAEHPVLVKEKGWVKAGDLTKSDVLMKISDVSIVWSDKSKNFGTSRGPKKWTVESTFKQQKTREERKQLGMEYHGSKGHVSPKREKTYAEFFGETRAIEIVEKGKQTKLQNGSSVGMGFNFRSKVDNFSGENNPNWRGGVSFGEYGEEFNSALKYSIFQRDNFTCQICNVYPCQRLNVHHIDYDKKHNDVSNLITLCISCHMKTNFNREYWMQKCLDIMEEKEKNKNVVTNGTRILAIAREHYSGLVYNLEVEEDNSYAGKGLIYHNCNIIDDAFLYLAKEYVEGQGDEVRSKVIEIRNINPALIEFDLDQNGLPKNSHFMCLIHRDTVLSTEAGKCPECERNLVPAMYIYRHRGKVIYLFDSEIIHVSKFWPGNETYGWSPILTIFEKVLTIIGMDRMQYRYFWERKVPSGMIFIFTDDVDSIRAERAEMEAKLRMDPSYVPMIGVQSRTNRGRVDMVRLFHTLQEMEYVPVRQEIRERIASMWGVSPIWQGALEASGGIASQTQQLVVMSRVVEGDQRIFHEKVFPQILEAFGVTDWKLELPQPEEMAESTRLQFSLQKISAAAQLSQMGFEVEAISEEGVELADLDFKISGKAKSQLEQQKEMMAFQQEQQQKAQAAMGGGGGLGGLFGGGGAPDGGFPGQEDEGGSPALPGASEEPSEEEPVEEENEQQQQLPSFLQRAHEKRFFNKLRSNSTMMTDLLQKGFIAPIMKSLAPDGTSMIFESMGKPYVADLEGGRIVNISKYSPPALHQHNGMPLHSISMQHNQTPNINDIKKIPEQMLKELERGD